MSNTSKLDTKYWDTVVEWLERHAPEMWQQVCPRRYVVPPTHYNPTEVSHLVAEVVVRKLRSFRSETLAEAHSEEYIALLGHALCDLKWPTYFVGKEFAEAVYESKVDLDMPVAEMPLLDGAVNFVMPKDSIFPYKFLIMASITKEKYPKLPGPMLLMCAITEKEGDLVFAVISHSSSLSKWLTYASEIVPLPGEKLNDPHDRATVTNTVAKFGMKLCLVAAAVPEMLEKGEVVRRAKMKHGRMQNELWKPNVLGFRYRHPAMPSQGGHHASPRLHRRCRHIRHQAHGPGLSLRKIIWVAATWVGVSLEEAA